MMSTLQSYNYEDVHPVIEKKDTQESHLLIIHIPDGFSRGDIGAKVEYDFGRVRVFGERSIGSNKIIRFNEKYQVPSHCDIGNIKGKFDGKIVTIAMPNIPGKVPQQEPIEDINNAAEVNDQKDQQNTSNQDPKSNVESKEDSSTQEAQKEQEENSQKGQVTKVDSKGKTYNETSTSKDATKESITHKGQEENSQKESISQKDQQEISQKETAPQNDQEEISTKTSIPQKGQDEISQKSQVTKATHESKPQEGQDQGITNKVIETKDAKLQTQENTSSLKDENKENQKIVNEETKDHLKKTIESGKPHVVDDSSPTLEKDTKEESKGSASVETFPPKKTFIEKGKEMINDKLGDDNAEKKSDKKDIYETTRTRIKDMALSTTQAVTSYAKRFNEEDKQKLIYTGATILVVALGVYASYKYRSSRRL